MGLVVRISGRERAEELPVPAGRSDHDELTRFLNRQGPYAQIWILLASGEYVRYEQIVAIREDPGGAARPGGTEAVH